MMIFFYYHKSISCELKPHSIFLNPRTTHAGTKVCEAGGNITPLILASTFYLSWFYLSPTESLSMDDSSFQWAKEQTFAH